MFEGVPNYPDAGRCWEVIDKHQVTIFYTAPTAIRALMREGDEFVTKHRRTSLRLLGSVGEPINPEAWEWYHRVVGDHRCPIVDTWWQTETGGMMITPIPGATPTKPGTATLPFFGVDAAIVDDKGKELGANQGGKLVIRKPWPGMLRGIWGDKARYKQTYWSEFKGMYFAGDGARRDKDGYFWIVGRIDDVLNVAGHRLGTSEVESALVSHPSVAEAAVVGKPDELKGQAVVCFVTVKSGITTNKDLAAELKKHVRTVIGPVATPDEIRFTDALPKTRSGKIMRRLLKQVAAGELVTGDTTTLDDLSVLAKLATAED
jgi:acetyl-CoA synthetase